MKGLKSDEVIAVSAESGKHLSVFSEEQLTFDYSDYEELMDSFNDSMGNGEVIMEKTVLWAFFEPKTSEWHIGSNSNNHRKNTEEAGYLVRDLWVQL